MDFSSPKLLDQLRWSNYFVFSDGLNHSVHGIPASVFPHLGAAQSSEDLRSSTFQSASYLRYFRSKSGRGTFPKRHVNVNHRNDESKPLEILTNEYRKWWFVKGISSSNMAIWGIYVKRQRGFPPAFFERGYHLWKDMFYQIAGIPNPFNRMGV